MSNIAHTMPFMILNEEDLKMAHSCLKSLSQGSDKGVLVLFNQGYLSNDELGVFLEKYEMDSVVIGDGHNVGIPIGRQKCFEYIWENMPEVDYISEIHVDMVFTQDWANIIMDYLKNSDEPMMSPGILTGFGELHPENKGIKCVDVPLTNKEIIALLHKLKKDQVLEGFVHPVIHKAPILKAIGGYDTRFLRGKQSYEDDSVLLGYRYYMGIKNNWKPKALLSSRVLHISLAQRMKLDNIQTETNTNQKGLIEQYGVYGLYQLAAIHRNQQFDLIAESTIKKNLNQETKSSSPNKKRVLIASPVHQKPEILELFLKSLKNVNKEKFVADYIFCDDNIDKKSSALLNDFSDAKSRVILFKGKQELGYICDDKSHHWKEDLVWKVAAYKDKMIKVAIEEGYDYLFFIDSDLLLYPQTIAHLIATKKDIISNIFWTKWQPDQHLMPNVWLSGVYSMIEKKREEKLTKEETLQRYKTFLKRLCNPGVYEVGGLGACTLLSRKALLSGVNFKEIENLDYWGEDRHFCIRAKALGQKLFVATANPAYHIYRESDIEGAKAFMKKIILERQKIIGEGLRSFKRLYKENNNKLVLSMVVKNEAGRYLKQVLTEAKKYIDEAIIIDDASDDNSVTLCKEVLEGIPFRIVTNIESKFSNEIELRKQQWEETIKANPDWILNLDADEIFEKGIVDEIHQLINQKEIDVYYFRLYDFWGENEYRDDQYWRAHKSYRPFLLRYQRHYRYEWLDQPQHCGRFPNNIHLLSKGTSSLRLKHYGWAREEDRVKKYNRYMALDQGAKYGWQAQYESILDEDPNLVKWEE